MVVLVVSDSRLINSQSINVVQHRLDILHESDLDMSLNKRSRAVLKSEEQNSLLLLLRPSYLQMPAASGGRSQHRWLQGRKINGTKNKALLCIATTAETLLLLSLLLLLICHLTVWRFSRRNLRESVPTWPLARGTKVNFPK